MQYLKNMGYGFKRVFSILAVCCVLSLMILTFSSNQKSYAQTPCTAPGVGAGFSLSSVWSAVESAAISAAQAAIVAYQAALMALVETAMQDIMQIFMDQLNEWTDSFYSNDLRPGLMDMTAQLHTSNIDGSRIQASFLDAAGLNETVDLLDNVNNDAARAHQPSELQCMAASLTSGLQRMNSLKKGYARAAPIENAPEMGAAVGTPAAGGGQAYQRAKLDTFCNRYVNAQMNNGASPCPAGPAPLFVDEDIEPSKLFSDTYDVTDVDLRTNMDDFIKNAVGIRPVPVQNPESFNSPNGREKFMDSQEYLAKQQLAYAGMYRVVACRVPGSDLGPQVLAHRDMAGTPNISPNPSWCEIEQAILESSAEDLQRKLAAEEPENVDRFLATLDIYQLTFGMGEVSDLMDYSSTIHAVQGATELEKTAVHSDMSGVRRK